MNSDVYLYLLTSDIYISVRVLLLLKLHTLFEVWPSCYHLYSQRLLGVCIRSLPI